MNIAIVGGTGFIGFHTANELKKHGHKVTLIDKKCFGLSEEYNKFNIINVDVRYYDEIKKALTWCQPDVVYMFAAISDSKENHQNVPNAVETNIMCLTNTIQAMAELNISRIIFSSTVWVYSVCNETEVDENTNLSISNSEHIYTSSKLMCEAIIRNFCSFNDVDYTILRYGIAYGPNCHPDTILSKFITNALNNKPLTVTGDGSIYRNFLYVTDHARGNRLALSEKAKNQIINLEGSEKITLKRVGERIKDLHDGDVELNFTGERLGDYKGKIVSNKKSKELLDWEPEVTFEEGSKKLYEYIKESISHSTAC